MYPNLGCIRQLDYPSQTILCEDREQTSLSMGLDYRLQLNHIAHRAYDYALFFESR